MEPMKRTTRRIVAALGVVGLVGLVGLAWLWGQLPAIGAGGLLHPARHATTLAPPEHCVAADFDGAGVTLKGWRCQAAAPARGTIVYLHGIADNRSSATGVIQRFVARGFSVIAYDSRAHGDSQGDACTYGFFEKQDLHRVIDTLTPGPVVLIGTSLGAAVALQEAADDRRVSAVVAAETFSDLRAVATERAPRFFTSGVIDRAFDVAGAEGHFRADEVQPQQSAQRITAPVLVIHGADDTETPPAHSQRVYAALRGPKLLILVPGAGHNGSLRSDVWKQIEQWIDEVLPVASVARAQRQ
jgi:alpha-beta hydrolase superfamily lysophospholipase